MQNIYSKDIGFDLVLTNLQAQNSEQVMRVCSDKIARHIKTSSSLFFDGLMERERFERSLVGEGLVIADMKVKGLVSPVVMLATLENEVDFSAPDGAPVNVVSILLSPQRDGALHLRRLFRLSRLLKNGEFKHKLVEAEDDASLRSILEHPEGWTIAA